MCGIAGITTKNTVHPGTVEKMIARMKHRGPDDEGFSYYNGVALGQSRLSIIDLAGGHQPMLSRDKNLTLIFNGEIYNYKELTSELEEKGYAFETESDSEVLLHLYEEYGENMLEKLNGMFAFTIYDQKNETLFIARDRLGVKPLFYFFDGATLAFSSEIEGLRAVPEVKSGLTINHDALWHYFSLLYIPPPITIYNEINHLPAGSYAIFKNGKFDIKQYWTLRFAPDSTLTREAAMEEAERIIADSVKLRMQSDVPYGAYLSGGVDSSLIVTKMSEVSKEPVKTFTARIVSEQFDEVPFAKVVAENQKTEHRFLEVESIDFSLLRNLLGYLGQPFADPSIVPTYLISKKIREYVTVVLGGDGGDELFAGYDKYGHVLEDASDNTVRKAFINRVPEGVREKVLGKLKDRVEESDTFQHLIKREANHGYSGLELLRYLDVHFFLGGDILPKLDSMSMANSLEAREPLMDYRLVELAARLPKELLISKERNKVLLKEILEKYYPADFVNRQKVGFLIPVAEWLKSHVQLVLDRPLPQSLVGLVDRAALEEVVCEFENGKIEFANFIFAYLMFTYWAELAEV